jgi:hypothetical protein
MKISAITGVTLAFAFSLGGAAFAQSASQTDPSVDPNAPGNAAVKDIHSEGAPAAGHNSFTRSQAITQINQAGYDHVTGLWKSKEGLWHAHAHRDGSSVNVTLDYKGDVTPE